jgi:uncharacterized protein
MRDRGRGGEAAPVERADDTEGTPIDDVGVDHGRAQVLVAGERLDRADVGARLEHVIPRAAWERRLLPMADTRPGKLDQVNEILGSGEP